MLPFTKLCQGGNRFRLFALIIFVVGFFLYSPLYSGVRNAIDSIKVMRINSITQKILSKDHMILEGEVEVLLDQKIHILADIVEIDQEKQIVIAKIDRSAFVKLETPDVVMLADSVELHLTTRTGSAKNLKIHINGGFMSSSSAKKIDDQTWEMEHLKYTSCDHTVPHWVFSARRATLYKNSVLNASGLVFKIQKLPVFVFPGLVFPLQNRAGSGFLIPRFSFDSKLGFGVREQYYWLIGEHCDSTFGFNIIQRKGFILSDEFRWARSPDNYLLVNGQYAETWDAFLEKRGKIISSKDSHYTLQGKYFQPISVKSYDLRGLVRFDVGNDKRLGYVFFNDPEDVEDCFYNTAICRYRDRKNIAEGVIHAERSVRCQYTDISKKCSKGREEKVSVVYLPRYEWNTAYSKLFPHLYYRHDFVVDNAYLDTCEVEKFYVCKSLERFMKRLPSVDTQTARFLYKGRLQSSTKCFDQNFTFFVEPNLHLRSKVKENKAHYKGFARCGIEWALPEKMITSSYYDYVNYIQPLVRWTYLQKFVQDHWYHIDKYDRFYPENRLELILQNNWQIRSYDIDLQVSQGYDFYNRSDIFPLRRPIFQEHLSPFHLYAACTRDIGSSASLTLALDQEYEWSHFALLQSEVSATVAWKKFELYASYLYQSASTQKERELFSDISGFVLLGGTIPLGKEVFLHYDSNVFSDNGLTPLLNRVYLNYEGHCWGIGIGFEDKRYREYGRWKSEHTGTLSLHLESIGSFTQKFRRPVIYRAPKDYTG